MGSGLGAGCGEMVTVGSVVNGWDGSEGFSDWVGFFFLIKWFSCGFGYCFLLGLDATVGGGFDRPSWFRGRFPVRFKRIPKKKYRLSGISGLQYIH